MPQDLGFIGIHQIIGDMFGQASAKGDHLAHPGLADPEHAGDVIVCRFRMVLEVFKQPQAGSDRVCNNLLPTQTLFPFPLRDGFVRGEYGGFFASQNDLPLGLKPEKTAY